MVRPELVLLILWLTISAMRRQVMMSVTQSETFQLLQGRQLFTSTISRISFNVVTQGP
jgi:hypothetical protein